MTEKPATGGRELRNFGLLFSALGLIAGFFMIWKDHGHVWIPFALAGVFLLTGLAAPKLLAPFHRLWMRFAALLAWFNTRLLLSLFFFLVMTPMGLAMRLFGRDVLHKKTERSAASYWIKRDPAEKSKQSYEHLF